VHESNLAAALSLLESETKQFAFAVVLDPRCFGTPMSRPRYWMPAFALKTLEKLKMERSDAYTWVTHILDRLNDHGLVELSSVLLPDGHPVLAQHMELVAQRKAPWDGTDGDKDGLKWPQAHASSGRAWWTNLDVEAVLAKNPGIKALCRSLERLAG
jgi:hypothetical protein